MGGIPSLDQRSWRAGNCAKVAAAPAYAPAPAGRRTGSAAPWDTAAGDVPGAGSVADTGCPLFLVRTR